MDQDAEGKDKGEVEGPIEEERSQLKCKIL
jgi:hypothetical protein